MKKRDIFIIMTEDICPNFGCYGDTNAKTPRIDEFAKENIKFTYCSSAAPVCSAARTSLNLGMLGSCAGVGQHRSYYPLPDYIKNIGEYMQEAGYFTCIGKTDFNFIGGDQKGYDKKVRTTHSDDPDFGDSFRETIVEADKPIFMIQTTGCTHQSQYGYTDDTAKHRESMPRLKEEEYQNRDEIDIPGYHFDTPEARELWGQYHEKITTLDRMFGEAIDHIKALGKYEDSIIFFVGDNGHGIPAGKCDLWNEGVQVPFILHVPKEMESQFDLKEDQYGRYCDRLTSFIDFAPTCLSLAGAEIPEQMKQGHILLGENQSEDPTEIYSYSERVDELYENARCVREKDMLFTCDFGYSDTRRPNVYQTTTSPWFVRSMIEQGYEHNTPDTERRAFYRGMPRIAEQMFDMVNDPNQLDDLACKAEYAKETERMRELLLKNIKSHNDGVFMPEPFYYEFTQKTGLTNYEIFRNEECYPLDRLIDLWRDCVTGKEFDAITVENPCEKIMLAKFLADRGQNDKLLPLLDDESETVRAYAAFRLERKDIIEEICSTSKNMILLGYIVDLLAWWCDGRGTKTLEILIDRIFRKEEFEVNPRFIGPAITSVNMMSERYNYPMPEDVKDKHFTDFNKFASRMVLGQLKSRVR